MATRKEAFTKREKKKSAEVNDLYKWLRLGLTGSYQTKNRLTVCHINAPLLH
jgi:hypothetical protein